MKNEEHLIYVEDAPYYGRFWLAGIIGKKELQAAIENAEEVERLNELAARKNLDVHGVKWTIQPADAISIPKEKAEVLITGFKNALISPVPEDMVSPVYGTVEDNPRRLAVNVLTFPSLGIEVNPLLYSIAAQKSVDDLSIEEIADWLIPYLKLPDEDTRELLREMLS